MRRILNNQYIPHSNMAAPVKEKHGESVTFSVSVLVNNDGKPQKTLVKNAIRKFQDTDTWFDVFDVACEAVELPKTLTENFEKYALVQVSSDVSSTNVFDADPYDTIKTLKQFDPSLKYVTIKLKYPDLSESKGNEGETVDAFSILMTSTANKKKPTKMPSDKPMFTAKDRLYNDLVDDTPEIAFPRALQEDDVRRKMLVMVDAIWYVDGNQDKINAKLTADNKIPTRFSKYSGYNDYKKKRKAAPQMSSHDLKRHADVLFRLATSTYASSWSDFKDDLNSLSVCLQEYATYLEKSNTQQKFRQSLLQPARTCGDNSIVRPYPKCLGPIKPCYSILDQVMTEADEYSPVLFDEYIHSSTTFTKQSRQRFLDGLSLTHSVDVLSYDPGAGLGKVIFLWRVPEDRSPVEMMSSAANIHKSLEPKLPEYHSRQMRKEFVKTYSSVTDIPPHIMRAIYSDLTLDATVCQNPAIEARLRHAIVNEDPDIAIDLRSLNPGRPNDTFNVFFDQLEKEVSDMTATDERRHNNVEHFSKYISVRDLIDQTAKKCPEGTDIPSESTVLFAFVPKNAYTVVAKLFKGRINLQHKVQTRQLRAAHIDEHYCAAIFSYLKRYAVKFRDMSTMVCMDDKSKVDFGEPGMAVQSGVRGKKSLVPVTSVLGALDHDLCCKGSLTPSVCIDIDIPEQVEESFYRGQVYVTLKDSVFQPSSPFRHAVELQKILTQAYAESRPKPYLLMYTDGGPDHRTTYAAVKLSLIVLFKLLDLDILIAARTAPGHSWANPAERIMSLLNLAYQNVALHRTEMGSGFEQMLKACGSMSEIRKKAEKEDGLEAAWLRSIEQIVSLLNGRAERVQLKGKSFKTGTPESKQDVAEFESQIKQLIAPGITLGKYTKNDLKKVDGYREFMERHCREGHYVFQVRKCNVMTCCTPVRDPSGIVPSFLPDPEMDPDNRDHYKSFESVLGTNTSDRDRPSAQTTSVAKVAEEQQSNAIRVAGSSKKLYTMSLKTIESMLDVQEIKTIRDLAVQFTCTGAVTLAQSVLQRYSKEKQSHGDDMDFNTCLFQGAALCAACKKLKIRVEKGKVKEMCAVKRSCFDTLVTEMEKYAEAIDGEKKHVVKKRGTSFIDEVQRKMEEIVPEKKTRSDDDEDDNPVKTDYEEWKRKILENAAKLNDKS